MRSLFGKRKPGAVLDWETMPGTAREASPDKGSLHVATPSAKCEYLAQSQTIDLDPGSYAFSYEVQVRSGVVTVGVLNVGSNQWLTTRNHGAGTSWVQKFAIGTEGATVRLIVAAANPELSGAAVEVQHCRIERLASHSLLAMTATVEHREGGRKSITPQDNPLLIFTHIHKTAGISLTNLLVDNCASRAVYTPHILGRRAIDGTPKTVDSLDADISEARRHIGSAAAELQLFASHAPFGMHRHTGRECLYVSFLREPLQKCISHFTFSDGKRDSALAKTVLQHYDFDLERVLNERAAYEFMNDQTRVITGSPKVELGLDDLDLAKQIIRERFLLVGVTERHDECISYLRRFLHLPNITPYRLNVQKDKDARLSRVSDNARQQLLALNRIDSMLYEWVCNEYLPQRLN